MREAHLIKRPPWQIDRKMNRSADVRLILDSKGWTQAELAANMGTTQPTVSRWLKGSQPELEYYKKIDELIASIAVTDLTEKVSKLHNIFTIVGVLGLGETVKMDDVALDQSLEEIELPYGFALDNCAALICRGNSQYPRVKNGDVVIFHRGGVNPADLIGREAIVALENGDVLLKTIKSGQTPGQYRLESHNDAAIEYPEIKWAGEVLSIVPAGAWRKIR